MSGSTILVLQLVDKKKVVSEKAFLERVRRVAPRDLDWVGVLKKVKKVAGKEKRHWLLDKRLLYYKYGLYIPNVGKLKVRIATNDHDSLIARYFGQKKT